MTVSAVSVLLREKLLPPMRCAAALIAALSATRMDCIDMRVRLRTRIRRMKEENTKRTPITGRVRLMFKMLATFPLAVCLFSQIQANSQTKAIKNF